MHDGVPSHIACYVKQVFRRHFGDFRFIKHHFRTPWSPRFPYLNSCDFWVWGNLNTVVYRDPITSVSNLKESMSVAFPKSCCFQQSSMRFYAFRW
ncbi:hypothetical protein TNCV_886481 [Trichonephila clavipes]|nr:hypothetical protein TNCV_886481 [Trichonephila clavipes]